MSVMPLQNFVTRAMLVGSHTGKRQLYQVALTSCVIWLIAMFAITAIQMINEEQSSGLILSDALILSFVVAYLYALKYRQSEWLLIWLLVTAALGCVTPTEWIESISYYMPTITAYVAAICWGVFVRTWNYKNRSEPEDQYYERIVAALVMAVIFTVVPCADPIAHAMRGKPLQPGYLLIFAINVCATAITTFLLLKLVRELRRHRLSRI